MSLCSFTYRGCRDPLMIGRWLDLAAGAAERAGAGGRRRHDGATRSSDQTGNELDDESSFFFLSTGCVSASTTLLYWRQRASRQATGDLEQYAKPRHTPTTYCSSSMR